MEIVDPVAVYSPRTLAEGQEIARVLSESGVPARVIMEEVVVARADEQRAAEFFKSLQHSDTEVPADPSKPAFVTAVCEECGQSSTFTGEYFGTVQDCPHCGKFMDVGGSDADFDPGDPEDEETPDEE